jgi:hypothetical protein
MENNIFKYGTTPFLNPVNLNTLGLTSSVSHFHFVFSPYDTFSSVLK